MVIFVFLWAVSLGNISTPGWSCVFFTLALGGVVLLFHSHRLTHGLHLIFSAFSPLLCASASWSLFRRFVPV